MAGSAEREPRTILEHLLWQQDRTYEELVTDFLGVARSAGESATISARHLARLARGERSGAGTNPATRRVLQRMFGRPVDELLQPWAPSTDLDVLSPATVSGLVPLSSDVDERRVLTMAAQRARKFALIAGQSGTGAEVIDQLHEDVRRLALAYPQQPLAHILGDLVDTQDTIFTLLEQRQRPQQARQLYFLGSVVGGLLAKASHDLAEPHAAMAQARTAFLCADNADHDAVRAWLRGLQSMVAYWAGRTLEAARYAESGAEFARRAGNTTAVWLPMNEARAWAALGNAERTRAAISRAEDAWDDVRPDDLDELGGICTFTRSRQLYYAADALAWLPEEAAEAERYSTVAAEAYADPTAPDWAFGDQAGSHADLAIARIARGELEGAADAVAPVLDLPAEQRINGIIASAQRVHQALTRSPLAGDGAELQEQIEVFTHTSAKALPR
jgi:hypothetical protein